MIANTEIQDPKRIELLFEQITALIEQSRQRIATAVNMAEVYTKYHIGQYIVEEEQQGNDRAAYGKQVLKTLSEKLTERFGGGWSVETLEKCRKFYRVYSASISSTVQTEFIEAEKSSTVQTKLKNSGDEQLTNSPNFFLSWNHYQILMRINNPEERSFYEIEAKQQQWSVRQLSQQVNSSLYERLALSRNKDEVMRLAREGQWIEKPADIIKNPVTLEFLGAEARCFLFGIQAGKRHHQQNAAVSS